MVTVHALCDAVATVEGAAVNGVVTLHTPAHGLRTHGVEYFSALQRALALQFPDRSVTWVVDAGDDAGLALAAMDAGFTHLSVTLQGDARVRLVAVAQANGAKLFDKDTHIL